jgi:hypothetical protein
MEGKTAIGAIGVVGTLKHYAQSWRGHTAKFVSEVS